MLIFSLTALALGLGVITMFRVAPILRHAAAIRLLARIERHLDNLHPHRKDLPR